MGKFFLCFSIASVIVLLFIPIKITTDAYYLLKSKKISFSIRAFGKLKIAGGYLSTYRGGVAIHISDRKALIFGYKEMDEQRKRFSFKKLFTVNKLSFHIRTGAEYFLPLYAIETIKRVVGRINSSVRKRISSSVQLVNGDELYIASRLTVTTSLFRQAKVFSNYILRGIIKKWKMKKLTD